MTRSRSPRFLLLLQFKRYFYTAKFVHAGFASLCLFGGTMIDVPKDDVILMLEAGYIYLAMKRFKEARDLFQGVCELTPKHDVPRVALANVFFAQGKYLECIRTLKAAIKDKPDSAYAHAHLAEAQLFYGKKEDAIKTLEKTLELGTVSENGVKDFVENLKKLIADGYDPIELRKAFKSFLKEHNDKESDKSAEASDSGKGKIQA